VKMGNVESPQVEIPEEYIEVNDEPEPDKDDVVLNDPYALYRSEINAILAILPGSKVLPPSGKGLENKFAENLITYHIGELTTLLLPTQARAILGLVRSTFTLRLTERKVPPPIIKIEFQYPTTEEMNKYPDRFPPQYAPTPVMHQVLYRNQTKPTIGFFSKENINSFWAGKLDSEFLNPQLVRGKATMAAKLGISGAQLDGLLKEGLPFYIDAKQNKSGGDYNSYYFDMDRVERWVGIYKGDFFFANYMNSYQVCRQLGISGKTLDKLISIGELPFRLFLRKDIYTVEGRPVSHPKVFTELGYGYWFHVRDVELYMQKKQFDMVKGRAMLIARNVGTGIIDQSIQESEPEPGGIKRKPRLPDYIGGLPTEEKKAKIKANAGESPFTTIINSIVDRIKSFLDDEGYWLSPSALYSLVKSFSNLRDSNKVYKKRGNKSGDISIPQNLLLKLESRVADILSLGNVTPADIYYLTNTEQWIQNELLKIDTTEVGDSLESADDLLNYLDEAIKEVVEEVSEEVSA